MTKSYGKGRNLLVIENVPVIMCPSCGESYLTAETLHELERIKIHRRIICQISTSTCSNLPADRVASVGNQARSPTQSVALV